MIGEDPEILNGRGLETLRNYIAYWSPSIRFLQIVHVKRVFLVPILIYVVLGAGRAQCGIFSRVF